MLEGVVQVVCPHCDRDNRLPRERLRNPPLALPAEVRCSRDGPYSSRTSAASTSTCDTTTSPVLALFHAAWSGDSSALQSAFEKAAPQLEPNARLAVVDGPALDLAGRLKVVRYPTLLLLHHERELARAIGAMNLAQLLAWARPLIAAVVA
jgi:thioredoxin 2